MAIGLCSLSLRQLWPTPHSRDLTVLTSLLCLLTAAIFLQLYSRTTRNTRSSFKGQKEKEKQQGKRRVEATSSLEALKGRTRCPHFSASRYIHDGGRCDYFENKSSAKNPDHWARPMGRRRFLRAILNQSWIWTWLSWKSDAGRLEGNDDTCEQCGQALRQTGGAQAASLPDPPGIHHFCTSHMHIRIYALLRLQDRERINHLLSHTHTKLFYTLLRPVPRGLEVALGAGQTDESMVGNGTWL